IPGAAFTFLALLPWIDRGGLREWRHRRAILGTFAAGIVAMIALTVLGARDHPSTGGAGWNIREIAGMGLIQTDQRCTKCHSTNGVAGPLEAGQISHTDDWLAAHIADPEMIAPGLREAPSTSERDNAAILSALARFRAGPPPPIDQATRDRSIM